MEVTKLLDDYTEQLRVSDETTLSVPRDLLLHLIRYARLGLIAEQAADQWEKWRHPPRHGIPL